MKYPISAIISCFNEEDVIEECINRVDSCIELGEIIVVCGGTDKTFETALNLAKDNKKIRVIKNYGDSGKGHAIKLGISIAKYDLMCQVDADLQFMPEEICKLFEPILAGEADIAFGARFMPESNVTNYKFSFFRVLGNKIVNKYISILTKTKFYDITTGHKSWTREAIEAINFRDNKYLYEMEIAVRGVSTGQRIAMVPITYHNRQGGVSGHGNGLEEIKSIVFTGAMILIYATWIWFNGKLNK